MHNNFQNDDDDDFFSDNLSFGDNYNSAFDNPEDIDDFDGFGSDDDEEDEDEAYLRAETAPQQKDNDPFTEDLYNPDNALKKTVNKSSKIDSDSDDEFDDEFDDDSYDDDDDDDSLDNDLF